MPVQTVLLEVKILIEIQRPVVRRKQWPDAAPQKFRKEGPELARGTTAQVAEGGEEPYAPKLLFRDGGQLFPLYLEESGEHFVDTHVRRDL